MPVTAVGCERGAVDGSRRRRRRCPARAAPPRPVWTTRALVLLADCPVERGRAARSQRTAPRGRWRPARAPRTLAVMSGESGGPSPTILSAQSPVDTRRASGRGLPLWRGLEAGGFVERRGHAGVDRGGARGAPDDDRDQLRVSPGDPARVRDELPAHVRVNPVASAVGAGGRFHGVGCGAGARAAGDDVNTLLLDDRGSSGMRGRNSKSRRLA